MVKLNYLYFIVEQLKFLKYKRVNLYITEFILNDKIK